MPDPHKSEVRQTYTNTTQKNDSFLKLTPVIVVCVYVWYTPNLCRQYLMYTWDIDNRAARMTM